MTSTYEHISALLEKYISNNCSAEEQAELSRLLREADEPLYTRVMERYAEMAQSAPDVSHRNVQLLEAVMQKIHTIEEPAAPVRRLPRRALAIAASVALLLGVGAAALIYTDQRKAPIGSVERAEPGANKVMLTLSDGSTKELEEKPVEVIAEGQTRAQQQGGTIKYDVANSNAAVVYHTLSTPRGKQFKVVLSDGTTVWLNAASSLRFPTSFTGGERDVELTGEAYFAVSPDADKPFVVKSARSTIQVLGTEFNIMAYDNEPLHQALLVKGSIRVQTGNEQVLLEPGKMATIHEQGAKMSVNSADVKQITAWKDGRFSLNTTDVRSLMRQIERWFDVDVTFAGAVPERKFGGWLSQNVKLETFLEFLEENGVHTRLEGRKLIITQ